MSFLLDRPGVEINGKRILLKEVGKLADGVRRVVTLKGKVNFVDEEGQFVCMKTYEDCILFSCGLARVKENGLWGFVNKKGEEVCKCQFEKLMHYNGHYAAAYRDGGWFLVNEKGERVNNERFEGVTYFVGGYVRVEKNGKFGLFDRLGNRITEYIYDSIYSSTKATLNGEPVRVTYIC